MESIDKSLIENRAVDFDFINNYSQTNITTSVYIYIL